MPLLGLGHDVLSQLITTHDNSQQQKILSDGLHPCTHEPVRYALQVPVKVTLRLLTLTATGYNAHP